MLYEEGIQLFYCKRKATTIMQANFIISQVFGSIALLLVCVSYSFNNKKIFLFYQILANIFYSASFLSLNVLVGGANTIISTIRVFVLYFYEKKDKNPPIYLFLLFFSLYLASGLLLYQKSLDILAICSYEIFNIAMFVRDINFTRILMIPPNVMIAIYNLLNMTYANAILDFIEVVVLIFAVVKFNLLSRKKYRYLI